MEIVNKKHKEITSNQRIDMAAYFKIESDKAVYFSAAACIDFGIIPGLYMHFVNDGHLWFFYCNNEKDGFKITGRKGKNCALICDASFVNLLKKRMLICEGTKFPVVLSNSKFNGQHFVQIQFSKPIG